jgi:hypothetical protein
MNAIATKIKQDFAAKDRAKAAKQMVIYVLKGHDLSRAVNGLL